MATTVLDLYPARIPIGFVEIGGKRYPVQIANELKRALDKVYERVGGANGASTTDLAQTDDDDSGLEEFRHEAFKALEGLAMAPLAEAQVRIEELETQLAGLREQVTRLAGQINDMQQGAIYGRDS